MKEAARTSVDTMREGKAREFLQVFLKALLDLLLSSGANRASVRALVDARATASNLYKETKEERRGR